MAKIIQCMIKTTWTIGFIKLKCRKRNDYVIILVHIASFWCDIDVAFGNDGSTTCTGHRALLLDHSFAFVRICGRCGNVAN